MYNAYKCAMPPHQSGKSWNGSYVSILLLPQFLWVSPHFQTCRGPSVAATFVAVYALFGPTFPGTYNMKRCIYTLFYPVSRLRSYWDIFVWFSEVIQQWRKCF